MKKIISVLAASTLMVSTSSAANFIKNHYYMGGGLALEGGFYHDYGLGGALLLNGGKEIIKLGPGIIGAEAELSYSALASSYDSNDYDVDLRVLSLGLFATYKYTINKNLYIRPRFGPMFMSYSLDGDDYYDGYDYGYSRGYVALGIGVGYKLTKNMNLFSDFLVNHAGYRRLSVGLQFKIK